MSSQNALGKIRKCCRREPEIFKDTKVGGKEEMWVVACADCGSFSDHPSRSEAIHLWNLCDTDKNPIHKPLVDRLNKEARAIVQEKKR